MLTIEIPELELFDESTDEFFTVGPYHLVLEHSLKSVSKWEAKTHKPFIDEPMTPEVLMEYIKCMTVNQLKDQAAYNYISPKDLKKILEYMQNPMSAKKFRERKNTVRRRGSMCNEDFYVAMAQYGIPWECENWHFNRLSSLIRTFEENNSGGGSMFKNYKERQQFYRELNESRRKALGTSG